MCNRKKKPAGAVSMFGGIDPFSKPPKKATPSMEEAEDASLPEPALKATKTESGSRDTTPSKPIPVKTSGGGLFDMDDEDIFSVSGGSTKKAKLVAQRP